MSTTTSRLLVTEPRVWFITAFSTGIGPEFANALVLQLDVTQLDQVTAAISAAEAKRPRFARCSN